MKRDTDRLIKTTWDLLVIGGGINGAAIANMASATGIKVALIEKDDFASGTSSKSTKLLHGGIRYLENFEFDLVRESLKERYIQWQSVPYLAKPLAFVVPVYAHDKRPMWMLHLGVWLYDFLAGKYKIGQHRVLSIDDVLAQAPGITPQGLKGGLLYHDIQMDDSRIVLENALMAQRRGACILNNVRFVDFIKENGHATGVRVMNQETEKESEVFAKKIIVAAGPWADSFRRKDSLHTLPRLRGSKGVHIVYRGQLSKSAFVLATKEDNRVFFVIPFHGNTLIGTTDTDYNDLPDKVAVSDDDIRYLLQGASRIFGHVRFDKANIIDSFAGIRPLVYEKGNISKVSRKHVIEKSYTGVWYVMGGKYTTYRVIAQETLERAMPELKRKMISHNPYVLYGSGGVNEELKILRSRYGVSIDTLRYLMGLYGSKFMDVLAYTVKNPLLKEPLCTCSDAIAAQVIYSKEVEMARNADDIFYRRLSLQYLDCKTRQCYQRIEILLQEKFES